jgi:UPF0176 protein
MENCCSTECQEIIHMPLVEQVKLRRGIKNGNMIFRKGKSDKLKFKHSGELSDVSLAKAVEPKDIRQKIKIKKVLIGKAEHYYAKSEIAQFLIENQEMKIGDKVLVSGPTTGNEEITIQKMFVNGSEAEVAHKGDKVTFTLPFRVRLSDKLFKILE